jgi:hypothetical protein
LSETVRICTWNGAKHQTNNVDSRLVGAECGRERAGNIAPPWRDKVKKKNKQLAAYVA